MANILNNVEALKGLYVALGGDIADVADISTSADMIYALETVAQAAASELPVVKKADAGSILMVNGNGKWSKAAAELPAVTSEDEGDVLIVDSSGNWVKDRVSFDLSLPEGIESTSGMYLSFQGDKAVLRFEHLEMQNYGDFVLDNEGYYTGKVCYGYLWKDESGSYVKYIPNTTDLSKLMRGSLTVTSIKFYDITVGSKTCRLYGYSHLSAPSSTNIGYSFAKTTLHDTSSSNDGEVYVISKFEVIGASSGEDYAFDVKFKLNKLAFDTIT